MNSQPTTEELIFIIGIGIVLLGVCIGIAGENLSSVYKRFKSIPSKIHIGRKKYENHITVYMSFKKWKRLFEIDPTIFDFITLGGSDVDTRQVQKYCFHTTHPVYYDKDADQIYVINFRFLDFWKYRFYDRAIQDKISYISEDKITRIIVGDVQSKIDAIVEESNRNLQNTVDLQQQIILRMNSGTTKKEGASS